MEGTENCNYKLIEVLNIKPLKMETGNNGIKINSYDVELKAACGFEQMENYHLYKIFFKICDFTL